MSDGWLLTGGIIVLFIGAFIAETYRVPRIEKWGRRQSFTRLDTSSGETISRLKHFIELFGDGAKPEKWGLAMTGCSPDVTVTIAECDLRTGVKEKYWYNLVAMVHTGPGIPEFRLESTNRVLEGSSRILSLPLWPLIYLTERAGRSRVEKWLDQWVERKKELPVVDFSEDPEFARYFKVFGDMLAAKSTLNPVMRAALLRQGWKGDLVACGDTVVWRRKGLLWPSRMDRRFAEVRLFQDILRGA